MRARLLLTLLILLPSIAQAAPDDMPPLSLHTQMELLLFPLGVIVLTICLILWHRRKQKR